MLTMYKQKAVNPRSPICSARESVELKDNASLFCCKSSILSDAKLAFPLLTGEKRTNRSSTRKQVATQCPRNRQLSFSSCGERICGELRRRVHRRERMRFDVNVLFFFLLKFRIFPWSFSLFSCAFPLHENTKEKAKLAACGATSLRNEQSARNIKTEQMITTQRRLRSSVTLTSTIAMSCM